MILRLTILGLLSALPLAAADTRLVRETEALTPEQELAKLHVPAGFEVQLFAAEPMVNKPINIAFDARGRLWVSSTVEYPYSAAKERWSDAQGTRVKGSRDAIKILEDTDGDGRADKVIDFADGLNIPTGVLPWHKPEHQDGCIAWSIPNIWYLADTNGDGKADLREVLFGPLGYEKDTHGMCSSFRLGMDGWVYATHGFNNTSHFKARDGSTLDLHSGNVFRFRPDASRVEIWSWGQVNPFGLCWDRHGNLYSADCHSAPVYQLLRGAHYPSFGKPHDGLGFGPVMCEHTHGSTGICGIATIDGGVWGSDWDDHLFVGNVVTSRINHDKVTFTGSTPKANEQPDFLTSDDPWFRPVDLQLGPDNALYIADFYNRIIGHYEVPLEHPGRDKERGRIWRVIKQGVQPIRRVIQRPPIGQTEAEWLAALTASSPFIQRAAVEALHDRPQADALPALIRLIQNTPSEDVQLQHAIRLALREHLKLPGAFAMLDDSAYPLAAGIALAVPTQESADFVLRNWEKKEPGTASSERLRSLTHIARYGDAASLARAIALAKLQTETDSVRQTDALKAIHDGLTERGAPATAESLRWGQELAADLLATLSRQPVSIWEPEVHEKSAPAWALRSRKCADGREAPVLQSMNKGGGDEESRTGVLRSRTFAAPGKLSFWLCGHRGFPPAAEHNKNLVRLVDAHSGNVLARAFPPRSDTCQPGEWDLAKHAGREVRLEIVDGDDGKAYAWLGVTRIEPPVVKVSDYGGEDSIRASLRTLAMLLQHTAPAELREKLLGFLPPRAVPPPLAVSPEQRTQMDALIKTRATGYPKATPNIAQGGQLFASNCAACHQIGGKGGLIGPQLDGISNRGVERLCEDILDPNRNVDAHFNLHTLRLRDGGTLSGFVRAEVGQVLILVDMTGREHRVAKSNLVEEQTLPVSLMPSGFGQIFTDEQFSDLLGWLIEQR